MERITNLLGIQARPQDMPFWRAGTIRNCSGLPDSPTREFSRNSSVEDEVRQLRLKVAQREAELEMERIRRRHADEALEASEASKAAFFNAIADPIFRLRRDGIIVALHLPPTIELPSSIQLIGKSLYDLLPRNIAEQVIFYGQRALLEGQSQVVRLQRPIPAIPRDYETRLVSCGEDQILALVREIPDHSLLEREVIEVCERERERIGQDLHDSLGQQLSGIKFLCTALSQKVARQEPIDSSEIAYIGSEIGQALQQARSLARGLYVVDLEEKGLEGALSYLARHIEKLSVQCHLLWNASPSNLSQTAARHLYHIAQEATTNAIKHGDAKNIWIEAATDRGEFRLVIRDDGVGFPKEASVDGIGLQIMKCRARTMGATLLIRREHPGGTGVVCSLPLAG